MPLDTVNLLDSTLFLESTGEEFKAAVALICKSWRQVPAGSLPNSEKALATLSAAEDWTAVRTMAMRNWVLCADGRWYHPIVAAKAMEALPMRQEFVEKKTAESDRKERERKDRKDMFAKLRAAGIVLHFSTKTKELRERVKQLEAGVSAADDPALVTQTGGALVTHLSRELSRLGQGQGPDPTGTLLKEELPFCEGVAPPSPDGQGSLVPLAAKPTKRKPRPKGDPPPTNAVWEAYSEAYEARYSVKPTRNAKVNGQLAHFVASVPADEAPQIAAFYLRLPGYAGKLHPVDLLLRDVTGIRTQWQQARAGISGPAPRPSFQSSRAASAAAAVPGLAARGDSPSTTLDVEARDVTTRPFALQDH